MATAASSKVRPDSYYPHSDGKPMAETPWHRDNLLGLVAVLQQWYADEPMAYVSGNMFIYYEPGNRRRHVSPDVFVSLRVPRLPERPVYFVWKEGKGPDVVIELTSKSTRREDLKTKFDLYQNVLRVPEYFLFDPEEDYLEPSLQGFRLQKGRYVPVRPVKGRLPSKVLGLHLERDGWQLRLYDPATRRRLPTLQEQVEQAETARRRAEQAEAEVERLRRELEALKRRGNGRS